MINNKRIICNIKKNANNVIQNNVCVFLLKKNLTLRLFLKLAVYINMNLLSYNYE